MEAYIEKNNCSVIKLVLPILDVYSSCKEVKPRYSSLLSSSIILGFIVPPSFTKDRKTRKLG